MSGEDDPHLVGTFQSILYATRGLGEPLTTGTLAFWLWKARCLPTIPDWIAEPYRLIIVGEHAKAAAMWEDKGMPYE